MKKPGIVLLAVALLFGFAACGDGKQSSQTNDFDAGTVEYQDAGYSYQVPGAWPSNDDDDIRLFVLERGEKRTLLAVYGVALESKALDAGVVEFILNDFVDNMEDVSMVSQEEKENQNGLPYIHSTILGGIREARFSVDMAFFDTTEGVLAIVILKELGSKKDFTDDFTKILDSVAVV